MELFCRLLRCAFGASSMNGAIVGGKMNQKSIGVEFRRTPHRSLGTHNLLDIADQRRTLAALVSQGMHHYVELLAVHLEIVTGPIGTNFRRGVDHDVPIRKLP